MGFFGAFILGGCACVVFELVFQLFKGLAVPTLLIIGIAVGALLTALGVSATLLDWGGAALIIMVLGAGEAVVSSVTAALYGVLLAPCIVLGVFVMIPVLGILAGFIYDKTHT